jgi:hypothetical protein
MDVEIPVSHESLAAFPLLEMFTTGGLRSQEKSEKSLHCPPPFLANRTEALQIRCSIERPGQRRCRYSATRRLWQ